LKEERVVKQKPPKTHRDDLTCTVCGGNFAGHIASKYCAACKEARKKPKEPEGDPPTGSEMEVEAQAPEVPARDPGYRKKIHIDRDRERYDGRRRREGDRDGARGKAMDALSKETSEERARTIASVRLGMSVELVAMASNSSSRVASIGFPLLINWNNCWRRDGEVVRGLARRPDSARMTCRIDDRGWPIVFSTESWRC
jgi:hypothetical protein